jgi:hypothetical protein
MSDKVRENKLRRMAARQRVVISKSRTRDPRAADFGRFMLTDSSHSTVLVGGDPHAYSATLDEIEAWLTR